MVPLAADTGRLGTEHGEIVHHCWRSRRDQRMASSITPLTRYSNGVGDIRHSHPESSATRSGKRHMKMLHPCEVLAAPPWPGKPIAPSDVPTPKVTTRNHAGSLARLPHAILSTRDCGASCPIAGQTNKPCHRIRGCCHHPLHAPGHRHVSRIAGLWRRLCLWRRTRF